MRGKRMNKRKSKKYFTRTAMRTHKRNVMSRKRPMRGGIRL